MTVSEPRFLIVGQVLKPWGYRGDVKIQILTDFPERLAKLKTVYLGPDARVVKVERARLHSGFASMKFEGYDTPEAAAKLRGQLVQIPVEDAVRLRKGQYFHHQVIGLTVVTTEGAKIGMVEDILETGANDVYLVRGTEGKEFLLPAVKDVIQDIDLENGRMVVRLIPGLLD